MEYFSAIKKKKQDLLRNIRMWMNLKILPREGSQTERSSITGIHLLKISRK
jgi:hypothetical protein